MRRSTGLGFALLLTAGLSLAAPQAPTPRTFVGDISDSMCGLKHMMPGGAKACTEECVKNGSKYVLADQTHQKVYRLSDQDKAKNFAGAKVRVTGTLKDDTIEVSSIKAAK